MDAETAGQLAERAFQHRSAVRETAGMHNLFIYSNYAFCLTLSYIFSKIVEQGKNMAVNLVFTTFILFHMGVEQRWNNGTEPPA